MDEKCQASGTTEFIKPVAQQRAECCCHCRVSVVTLWGQDGPGERQIIFSHSNVNDLANFYSPYCYYS